ncbi:MAG TPA: hypothetical protein VGI10_17480 [Polyangiaceae bacterium]|jgi:hypothetical protein
MKRLVLSGFLLAACNPAAGFQNAADAINPAEKSYIESPGSQLTTGPYDTVGVDVDLDTQVHLLARRRDQANSIMLFGQYAQQGCRIAPNFLTWFVARPAQDPTRLLPYFETRDGTGVGRLRFSTIDCQLDPMTVENAHDPFGIDLKSGFLVPIGNGLAVVDPWHASTKTLLQKYYGLVQVAAPLILWGDDQIVSYDDDMNELGRFGNVVVGAAVDGVDGTIGLQDSVQNPDQTTTNVVERIVPPTDPSTPLVVETMLSDACDMQGYDMYNNGWVLVHSPCSATNVTGLYLGNSPITSPAMARTASFPTDVETWNARIFTATTDGKANDLTLFYLQDVDATSGLGTLYARRQADAAPVKLGDQASLTLVKLLPASPPDSGMPAGTAIVDAAGGLARWVAWNWDGTVQTLAENVYFDGSFSDIVANYDGTSGDAMSWSASGPVTTAHGVPPLNTTESSSSYPYTAHLEQYDGKNGDLMVINNGATQAVGARVPLNSYQFLDPLPMPGIAYLTNWDDSSSTGTLIAQNLRLGAQTTIASGVSAFTPTGYPLPGILFAVPQGSSAGIWFAQAK